MNVVETIGTAAQRALDLATGSSTPSASIGIALRPAEIVRPTNEAEAKALADWGSCSAKTEPKATHEQIGRHLEFIAATLPAKKVDTATGKNRFAVYVSTLNDVSEQALAYMSRRVCQELDWFPTPHQCLTILNGFTGDKPTRRLAVRYSQDFWQERMEEFLAELEQGDTHQLTTVPERWRSIAETRSLLRRLPSGDYELRVRRGENHPPTSGASRAPAQETDHSGAGEI